VHNLTNYICYWHVFFKTDHTSHAIALDEDGDMTAAIESFRAAVRYRGAICY
jgi:hypothetical protein